MAEGGGPYWKLATAQRVGMEEGIGPSPLRNEGVEARSMDIMESEGAGDEEGEGKEGGKGLVKGFGTLLVEQGRVRWGWYMALLLGVLIAGGESPCKSRWPLLTHLSESCRAGVCLRPCTVRLLPPR